MSAPTKEHSTANIAEENITPLFRPPCSDCAFCDGLRDMACQEKEAPLGALRLEEEETHDSAVDAGNTHMTMKGRRRRLRRERRFEVLTKRMVAELWRNLSFFDQYLALWILFAMITGVLIGVYAVSPSTFGTRRVPSGFYTGEHADCFSLQEKEVQRAFKGASWQGVSIRACPLRPSF